MKKELLDIIIGTGVGLVSMTIGTALVVGIIDKAIDVTGNYYTKIIRNRDYTKRIRNDKRRI